MNDEKDWDPNVFAGLEALRQGPDEPWPKDLGADADDEVAPDTADLQALGELELSSYPPRLA